MTENGEATRHCLWAERKWCYRANRCLLLGWLFCHEELMACDLRPWRTQAAARWQRRKEEGLDSEWRMSEENLTPISSGTGWYKVGHTELFTILYSFFIEFIMYTFIHCCITLVLSKLLKNFKHLIHYWNMLKNIQQGSGCWTTIPK